MYLSGGLTPANGVEHSVPVSAWTTSHSESTSAHKRAAESPKRHGWYK
jgi:hypothetical protein